MKKILILIFLFSKISVTHSQESDSTSSATQPYSIISLELKSGEKYTLDELNSFSIEYVYMNNWKSTVHLKLNNGVKKSIKGKNIKEIKLFDSKTENYYNCYSFGNLILLQFFDSPKVSMYKMLTNYDRYYFLQIGTAKPKQFTNTVENLLKHLKCKNLKDKYNYKANLRFSEMTWLGMEKAIEILNYYVKIC